jgi:phosphoribosylanthranilate isomerase
MAPVRVKICGVTNAADAAAAAAAGADAIGMVFYPNAPRGVGIDRARQIVQSLPPFVESVALFISDDPAHIIETAAAVGVSCVQLYGSFGPADLAALPRLRVIKAIKVAADALDAAMAPWRAAVQGGTVPNLAGFVLDTPNPGVAGGTGIANDFAGIAEARRRGVFDGLPPLIVAGGLRPENVAQVVRATRPWAVDVSSGIEASLGKKSAEKMAAFIDAARSA